jgi:hypothetical protein
VKGLWGAFALGGVTLAACAVERSGAPLPVQEQVMPQPPSTVSLASVTDAALADAARVSGLAPADLEVLSAEPVTWGDGSLGCPQEGMLYSQALVPGYRIRIAAKGRVLDYHASRDGRLQLCPASRAVPPLGDVAI